MHYAMAFKRKALLNEFKPKAREQKP